jgi:hypothetical protein
MHEVAHTPIRAGAIAILGPVMTGLAAELAAVYNWRGGHPRGVRAVGLPALRYRHLGAHVLRSGLPPAAGRYQRGRRAAEPDLPDRRQLPAEYNGYSGDIEVDADIETQLALAPDASRLIVYDAPNDETGQTELDEYTAIARQDVAESVSSSWGECENDAGASYTETENVIFEQMALQGRSLFNAAGDTGAYDCIRSDGTTVTNVMDPASQPWVTSAGGGGSSQFWGRPSYQRGPGINNPVHHPRQRHDPVLAGRRRHALP